MQNITISGRLVEKESWEKQQIFKLSNGFKITVEYNIHYGDMVTRMMISRDIGIVRMG